MSFALASTSENFAIAFSRSAKDSPGLSSAARVSARNGGTWLASSSSLPSLSLTAVSIESKADKRAKASGGVEAEVEVKEDISLVTLYKQGLAKRPSEA